MLYYVKHLLWRFICRIRSAKIAAAVTSSHFCSAERQFRLPLEYGGQRPPTAQWTATASGAAIVVPQSAIIEQNSVKIKNSKETDSSEKTPIITEICIGKIIDRALKTPIIWQQPWHLLRSKPY